MQKSKFKNIKIYIFYILVILASRVRRGTSRIRFWFHPDASSVFPRMTGLLLVCSLFVVTLFSFGGIVNASYFTTISGDIYSKSNLRMSIDGPISNVAPIPDNYYISQKSDLVYGDSGVLVYYDTTPDLGGISQTDPINFDNNIFISGGYPLLTSYNYDSILASYPKDKIIFVNPLSIVMPICNSGGLNSIPGYSDPEHQILVVTGDLEIGGSSCPQQLKPNQSYIILANNITLRSGIIRQTNQNNVITFIAQDTIDFSELDIYRSYGPEQTVMEGIFIAKIIIFPNSTTTPNTRSFNGKGVFIASGDPSSSEGFHFPFSDGNNNALNPEVVLEFDPKLLFGVNNLLRTFSSFEWKQTAP